MAFREVAVTEIREVLRAWLSGAGLRRVAEQAGVDRKTARRYVAAAAEAGLARDGGPGQLTDELVGQVAEAVRPVRPAGHGRPWEQLEACQGEIAGHEVTEHLLRFDYVHRAGVDREPDDGGHRHQAGGCQEGRAHRAQGHGSQVAPQVVAGGG